MMNQWLNIFLFISFRFQESNQPSKKEHNRIDSFHIVTSLSNRSSIEKSIKSFLQMKGQIAY